MGHERMTRDADAIRETLIARHGRTFADEMGIDLATGGPSELFKLLVGSSLMSARISSKIAMSAARALFRHGYTTAQAMADASWQDRVDALVEGSYRRFDESTASYLGDTAELLLDAYDGDLRQLRDAAERDPGRERSLLKECKGLGDVGVNIFFREAQTIWDELRPFADQKALDAARQLGLGSSAPALADVSGDDDLSLLVAALIRADLDDDLDAVRSGHADEPTTIELQRMTRDELYARAQDEGVEGRSQMSKDELIAALDSSQP